MKTIIIALCAAILLCQPLRADKHSPADGNRISPEAMSFRIGYSRAYHDLDHDNGGVADLEDIDDYGGALNLELLFSRHTDQWLKPYVDASYRRHDDRDFALFGLGLRHDFAASESGKWRFYVSGGIDYAVLNWSDSPAPAGFVTVEDRTESVALTLQGGVVYSLSERFGLDLSLRYDGYDLATEVLDFNRTTDIDDYGALTALLGVVYRFGRATAQTTSAVPAPDGDADHDGVADSLDDCPDTLHNVPVTGSGCPQPSFGFQLYFAFDSTDIAALVDSKTFGITRFMKKNTDYQVEIIGHTDSTGPAAYNQDLSERRAAAAKRVLVENGVAGERIATSGRGEFEPIADNATAEGRATNRRVQVEFTKRTVGSRP